MKIVVVDASGFSLPYDHCLCTGLTHKGCKVVLATTQKAWIKNVIYEQWENFYSIANNLPKSKISVYIKGFEHTFDMWSLLHRLQKWKPDIIHFQWIPLPFVDSLFLKQFRRVAPLVLTVHNTEPFHGSPSSKLQLLGIWSALKCFDHFIVHTNYSKESLIRQMALSENDVSVIPHGVFDYYCELVSSSGQTVHDPNFSGKMKILFFGIIKPYKGVDVLIKAFACMPEKLARKTVLQIVGYPKMPIEPLKILAQRLGVEERVIWDLRFIEEQEVADYFYRADVIVLPYRNIDQSGVLMIALAFGKPVIASNVGGFAEIIKNGVSGFLVEPGDVNSLAQALERVLEDDRLKAKIGKTAQKLAKGELSWDSVAAKTLALYKCILEEGEY